jgi:hypothetical protein
VICIFLIRVSFFFSEFSAALRLCAINFFAKDLVPARVRATHERKVAGSEFREQR